MLDVLLKRMGYGVRDAGKISNRQRLPALDIVSGCEENTQIIHPLSIPMVWRIDELVACFSRAKFFVMTDWGWVQLHNLIKKELGKFGVTFFS